jgi:hypothetical protein
VNPRRGIELDLARHPLTVVRAGGVYSNAEWNQMLLGITALIERGPFVVIADLRNGQMPNAVQRRSFIAMYENNDQLSRAHFLALGAVGESATLRRVITVLDWIRPAPHPVKVFATVSEAEAWVLEHLPAPLRQRVPPARSTPKG